jgi:hypothetical protein
MTQPGRVRLAPGLLRQGLGCPAVVQRTRGFLFVIAGLVLLALNVIDAADRGSSAGNIAAIAIGAFLLFWGFGVIARTGPPASR